MTAKQTWAIHYKDKILTDLSLQTNWKFESLFPPTTHDTRRPRKRQKIGMASCGWKNSQSLICPHSEFGRGVPCKVLERRKFSQGLLKVSRTKSYGIQGAQTSTNLISEWNTPFVHLDFSSKYLVLCLHFCMWIKHNFKQEHTTLYHWKHWDYGNSWLRFYRE